MGSMIQSINGDLINVEKIKNPNSIIQLVQLSDGTLKDLSSIIPGDKIISFEDKYFYENIFNIKHKQINRFIYIKLKNGFYILVPNYFKILFTLNAEIFSKNVSDLRTGEFIAIPSKYKTISTSIKFDPWDFDDFLFISGIKDWYSKKLTEVINDRGLLIKDISNELDIPYWKIRRNALSKDSINYGLIKIFLLKYFCKKDIYEAISLSNGFKNEKSAGKYAKVPFDYLEKLAYLDGLMVAEGHIVRNEKQAILEFADFEFTDKVKKLIKEVHAYDQKGYRINLPGFLAYFYSRFLQVPKGNKSKIVSFPPLSLKSRNNILLGALRGIVDGEGNVNSENLSISITSSSFRLVLGLASALLRIGISCSIRKSKKDSTWNVSINMGSMKRFAEEVRFLRCPKKDKALKYLGKINSDERTIIPNIGEYIKKLRIKKQMSPFKLARSIGLTNIQPMEKSGNFSFKSLSKINKIFNDKKINNILMKPFKWSKIVEIKTLDIKTKFIIPKTEGFFTLNHIFVKS